MKIKSIRRITLDEPIPVYDVINAAPNHNFFIDAGGTFVVSHNCFLDEVSFARNSDIKKQMEKAKVVFDAALERIESRFTKFGGVFDGLIIMASSKRTDQAFAEVYAKELMSGKKGYTTFVVDKPRWEVLPPGTYSGETFPLAIGDKLRPSEIITFEDVPTYEEAGYRIIYPPIETYDNFTRDMMQALTNIAGESVYASGTFLPGEHIAKCINPDIKNPFMHEVIYVGAKDDHMYQDFFDITRVEPDDLAAPIYIHLDASLGSDGNSISGGRILYAQDQRNLATGLVEPELHYKQIFKIKVRAPKGDRVMLRKNEQFIYWLRAQGFNIAMVTSDMYQCLAADSLIWTFDGYKRIADLQPGAEVLSYSIEEKQFVPTKVINVWQSRTEKQYTRITTHLGSIEATDDHLFLTTQGYKQAADLQAGDKIVGAADVPDSFQIVIASESIVSEVGIPFYDIEVESDNHNYLTECGVVHNSAQFGQDLTAAGIPYRYQSIDAVQHGVNRPYSVLRDAILEHRVQLLADKDQTEELLHLVKYENGKVDKPMDGNTDDASQCLCGWVYAASQDKENFIQHNVVISDTFLGNSGSERILAEQDILPKELVINHAEFINEFGAYKFDHLSGLRDEFDRVTNSGKKKKGGNEPPVSPFNFF